MNVNSRDEKVKQSNKTEQNRWPACWKGCILPYSPVCEFLEDTAFLIPVTKLIG
jgi:hypothetical protein